MRPASVEFISTEALSISRVPPGPPSVALECDRHAAYNAMMGPIQRKPTETNHPTGDIPAIWLEEFEAAARRPLPTRFRFAFIRTYKPVLDDASFRAFDTTADYRRWCEENLPDWLGYGRV